MTKTECKCRGIDILAAEPREKSGIPEAFRAPAAQQARRFHRQIEGY